MKNHIVFKFLAIVLCAASLMGAVAGGAGILVMTEIDLYRKTVEEAYRDALAGYVESYAGDMALQYAAKELGGASDALVESYYSSGWYYDVFTPGYIGYTIFDEAGNVLADASLNDGYEVEYTFLHQSGGNYLKVLSEMTQEEYQGTVELPEGTSTEIENGTVYNAIEEGGTEVYFVEMQFPDGEDENIAPPEAYLGTLYANVDGTVEFFSAEGVDLLSGHLDAGVTRLAFRNRSGQLVYEITCPDGIALEGRYQDDMTYLMLYSTLEQAFVYDAIPDGGAEVYTIEVQYSDGSSERIHSPEEPLGVIFFTPEGNVAFHAEDDYLLQKPENGQILTHILFLAQDGTSIYEASSPNGVLQSESWGQGSGYSMTLRNLEEEVMVYDAIPSEGCAITNVYVAYADEFAESVGGTPDIGFLDYDENGNVQFTFKGTGALTPNDSPITHIQFHDANGELVYEARDPAGVGFLYEENGNQVFRAGTIDTPVEETVPAVTEVPADTQDTIVGTVKAHTNIYASASLSSPVTGFLTAGDTVEIGQQVTEENLNWGWIPGSGWVLMDGIAMESEEMPDNTPADQELKVEAFQAEAQEDLDVYSDPDRVHVVGTFAKGDILSVIRTETTNGEEWALTDQGWVKMAGLIPLEIPVMEFDLVIQEENFLAEVQKKLYIQSTPNGNAAVVGTLEQGDIVTVIKTETSEGVVWALTDLGWVPMEQLVPVEVPVSETATEETVFPTMEATEVTEVPDATEVTEPLYEAAMLTSDGQDLYSYYDYVSGGRKYAEYTLEPMPALTVEVQLAPDAFLYEHEWVLIRLVYALKDQLAYILAGCLLLFAILAVYLCCAAGRKPGTKEVRAGGLNAMPLELYACVVIGGVAAFGVIGVEGAPYLLRSNTLNAVLCAVLSAYGISLLIVAFCFACAAQFKTPGGYWWRNSLTGRCIKLLGKGGRLLLKCFEKLDSQWDVKLWPGMKRLVMGLIAVLTVLVKKLWKWILFLFHLLEAGTEKLGKALNRFFSMLPLTWQWLLAGGVMIFFLFVTVASRYDTGIVLSILFAVALVIYGAHCFGSLLESAKRMSKGDLDEKVDDKLMVGAFKDFAGELNGLADVAVVAAQKQLKSERMKTELITNVSHDIKTPLTSIINYVDLLQKPHSPEDEEKYLEVLDRQSQRLKKLIDDLMEMSKASTGNMSVDISRVDAAEAVNQALGEFADKLDKARLYPVFRQPEESVYMMADGRLVWRVMSNLLSNAVKYALPGTRLYVDLQKVESKVIISMKNISREELNVNADELLERFVRGDASRNTEGSGLGLNIAQSLMELQKGQLQILVDGDLFKVTLIFPGE